MRRAASVALLIALAGCGGLTDPATRLGADIAAASDDLADREGARFALVHETPSQPGECEGPYRVQLDRVGALFIWCKDASGATVSSHSTSYHGSFVDTDHTIVVDKPARAPLRIELIRRNGRATLVGAT